MSRICSSCAAAVLISLAGCTDDGTGAEDLDGNTDVDTGGDSDALAGDWQPGAGLESGTCAGMPVGAPLTTDPLALVAIGDGGLELTLTNGCVVPLEATATGAQLVESVSCTGQHQGLSASFEILDANFEVRSSDPDPGADPQASPDEATLTLAYDLSTPDFDCALDYDAQLTRDSGPAPLDEVATFMVGDFIESVERDEDGNTWIMSIGPSGAGVFRIPDGGSPELVAPYPPETFGAIVFDADGRLFASVAPFNVPDGPREIVEIIDAELVTLAELPEDSMPNGITVDADGNLYAADAVGGRVFRLSPGTTEAEVWVEGGALAVVPGGFPGPDGIKVFDDHVYVSNPSQLNLSRTPINADGSAGSPAIVASAVPIDDFALDVDGGIWATTHPFNGLVLIRPDGSVRLIHDKFDDLWGPSAAIFGAGPDERSALYVVTDGNLFGSALPPWMSQSPDLSPARVLRTTLEVEGAPVP